CPPRPAPRRHTSQPFSNCFSPKMRSQFQLLSLKGETDNKKTPVRGGWDGKWQAGSQDNTTISPAHTHAHTHRHTDTQTHRHTDTHTHTHTQTHRHTHTHTDTDTHTPMKHLPMHT